ncbi:hypothetical protein LNTAR_20558 [Lentisphaera araneosa HTCC2155]|jgi:hypothetical protein|uniref:Sulfotransferase family protein n=1 Tax=Lentisphaera araneosa HTCC2155 TaxID=313628 RepID=A6DL34_9BACT|nr:sulfotransferase family 2 domain-containing protein [Lentisphaera araneosa]EDM27636.1 hypothetical protein LNTAR_20558 [Lentisphaera araneosa HTCC2155]
MFEKVRKNLKLKRYKPEVWSLNEGKVVFISIPKNASRSIRRTLTSYISGVDVVDVTKENLPSLVEGHVTRLKQSKISKEFSQAFIFSFVRNPYKRIFSCWKNKIGNQPNGDCIFSHWGMSMETSFDEFVDIVCATPDEMADRHFRSQSWFLCDDQGVLVPDFIGKLENMNHSWTKVQNKIDVPNIPHVNSSNSKDLNLSRRNIDLINERFKDDFNNFSYEFL